MAVLAPQQKAEKTALLSLLLVEHDWSFGNA
jgi:hypothetical protein